MVTAFNIIEPINDDLREAVVRLRKARELHPDELAGYGGSDYPRHLSLAITKVEEALLWLGSFTPDPEDDE